MRLRPLLLALSALLAAFVVALHEGLGVRTHLDALDPAFREKVSAILATMEAREHPARVATTWRDPRRQDLVYLAGRLGEFVGRGPGTLLRGGRSCHNRVVDGRPASVAVDLRPRDELDHAGQVAFYRALGRTAKARRLRWGGDWARRDPVWAKDGLGWDPGHVEDRGRCREGEGASHHTPAT